MVLYSGGKMKIVCTMNLDKNELDINNLFDEEKEIIVEFHTKSRKKTVDLEEIKFGYSFFEEKKELGSNSWPIPGVKLGITETGPLTGAIYPAKANNNYTLKAWMEYKEKKSTKRFSFKKDRPPPKYESMVWNEDEQEWQMLKPHPSDIHTYYVWNEKNLNWDAATAGDWYSRYRNENNL